jgi:hypothetical protein
MLTFAQFKEKVLAECTQLDEAHKIGNKVTIHKGTGAGITGHIGEIRKKFKGDTDPTYTVFHGDNQAITVSKNQIKAVKESLDEGLSKEELSAIKQHYSTQKHIMADIGDYEYYTKHNDNKSAESIAKKLKAMAIDDKVINEKFAHPNHKKLDANGSGELDAEDFKLLRAKKKTAAGKLTKEENEVLESLLAKLDEKCAMKSVKEDDAEEDDDEECEESCDSKAKK